MTRILWVSGVLFFCGYPLKSYFRSSSIYKSKVREFIFIGLIEIIIIEFIFKGENIRIIYLLL